MLFFFYYILLISARYEKMLYCSAPSPPLTRKKNISMKYNINLQGRAVEMQFH